MDSDNRSSRDNKPPRPGAGGGDPNFNWRSLIIIAIFFILIGAYYFAHNGPAAAAEEIRYDKFQRYLTDGQVFEDDKHPLELLIEEGSSTQTLSGYYSRLLPLNKDSAVAFHTTISLDFDHNLQDQLAKAGLTPNIRNKSNMLATTLIGFLPILIFLLILYFLFRQQIRMAGEGR